jgi:hypothetical protein
MIDWDDVGLATILGPVFLLVHFVVTALGWAGLGYTLRALNKVGLRVVSSIS